MDTISQLVLAGKVKVESELLNSYSRNRMYVGIAGPAPLCQARITATGTLQLLHISPSFFRFIIKGHVISPQHQHLPHCNVLTFPQTIWLGALSIEQTEQKYHREGTTAVMLSVFKS